MSEEIAAAAGDIAYWKERAERAEADLTEYRKALETALKQIDAEHDMTKALLIKMRRYIVAHDLLIGECVAWMELKRRYGIGTSTEQDEQWMREHTPTIPDWFWL